MATVVTHKGRGILSILHPRFNLLTELATFRPRKIIRPNNFVLRHPKSTRGSRISFSKLYFIEPPSRTSQDPTLYCARPGAPIVRGLGFRVQGWQWNPPPYQQTTAQQLLTTEPLKTINCNNPVTPTQKQLEKP